MRFLTDLNQGVYGNIESWINNKLKWADSDERRYKLREIAHELTIYDDKWIGNVRHRKGEPLFEWVTPI